MISEEDIFAAELAGANFRPAILEVRYLEDTDRVELVTRTCTLLVDRASIPELRNVTREAMKGISASPYGLHVETADVDINSAGLIADLAQKLRVDIADSF